jgi:hypothetical protein
MSSLLARYNPNLQQIATLNQQLAAVPTTYGDPQLMAQQQRLFDNLTYARQVEHRTMFRPNFLGGSSLSPSYIAGVKNDVGALQTTAVINPVISSMMAGATNGAFAKVTSINNANAAAARAGATRLSYIHAVPPSFANHTPLRGIPAASDYVGTLG